MLEVIEVNEKERNTESDVLRYLEMTHCSRSDLACRSLQEPFDRLRVNGDIKASNVESFGRGLNLVMRFFLGEIGLQKYYLAQWRW